MSQTVDIRELNERIESKSSFVNMITMGMDKVIVGQKHLVESLLIGLLSDGHTARLIVPQRWWTTGECSIAGFPNRYTNDGAFPRRFHFDLNLKYHSSQHPGL